jgi:Transposase, Mutator family/Aldehyde dehydrogenase family
MQGHCRRNERGLVSAALREIFDAEDLARAKTHLGEVLERFREPLPQVAALLEAAEEDLPAFNRFPAAHWSKLRSTHPLERLNKEIGRRSDLVGIESTVLTDTTLDMTVVREEIFGPVVCVIGLRLRGRRPQPQRQRHELRPRVGDLDARPRQGAPDRPPLRAGAVWINCYSVFDAAMPIRRL